MSGVRMPVTEPARRATCCTVLSYNVHRCIGTDGRMDPARIARVIRELAPHIVGLQEVDSRSAPHHGSLQLEHLAEATGMTAVAGPTILQHERFYGNALLTSCPVLAVRRVDITLPGREPRGLLDCDLLFDGHIARVLVTHLGLRFHERRYQVQRLLEALASDHGGVVILLGDINEWWPHGVSTRWLDERLGPAPRLRTFPSRLPLLALDRIWAHPLSALQDVRVHRTALTRIASDHLPLVASVRADALEPVGARLPVAAAGASDRELVGP
jgi:endonuclease/exonuclease/phosphatase family metal-dependent hydrolase